MSKGQKQESYIILPETIVIQKFELDTRRNNTICRSPASAKPGTYKVTTGKEKQRTIKRYSFGHHPENKLFTLK